MIQIARYKLPALVQSCIDHGIRYSFGAKVTPLTLQAGQFHQVDCSGFVDWAVYHATKAGVNAIGYTLPGGSVNQHDYARANFQKTDLQAPLNDPGHVFIAFLAPTSSRLGHVMLIQDGMTIESHGGAGPSRRRWLSLPWMHDCEVYILAVLE